MRLIAVLLSLAFLAGCATSGANRVPLVDMRGKDAAQFNLDVQECQAYARQTVGAGTGAAVGAVAGALLGAFLAPSGSRNYVAGRGAVLGGLAGGVHGNETQENVITRCLAGRGYNVLN
jgi:uncharacterized protein YcfJ